jgi:hypothetical protein
VQPAGHQQTPLEQAFIDSFEAGIGRSVTLQSIEPDEAVVV